MLNPLDPMWVYGEPIELPNRQILTCNLYGKKNSRGIRRLKYHLARISGFDVDACEKTNPELMRIANQEIIDMANKKDAQEARKNELADKNIGTSAFGGDQNPTP
jgi:hypothetical protein